MEMRARLAVTVEHFADYNLGCSKREPRVTRDRNEVRGTADRKHPI
jgi:hypothetical protein